MKIKEALKEALEKNDIEKIGRIVDYLRMNPKVEYSYWDILKIAQECKPGLTQPEWDSMMEEVDELLINRDE